MSIKSIPKPFVDEARVRKLAAEGLSAAIIATRMGCSISKIRGILGPSSSTRPTADALRADVLRLWAEGKTANAVANHIGKDISVIKAMLGPNVDWRARGREVAAAHRVAYRAGEYDQDPG